MIEPAVNISINRSPLKTGDLYDYIDILIDGTEKRYTRPLETDKIVFKARGSIFHLNFNSKEETLLTNKEFAQVNLLNKGKAAFYAAQASVGGGMKDFDLLPDVPEPIPVPDFGTAVTTAKDKKRIITLDKKDYEAEIVIDSSVDEEKSAFIRKFYEKGSVEDYLREPITALEVNSDPVIVIQPGRTKSEPSKQTLCFIKLNKPVPGFEASGTAYSIKLTDVLNKPNSNSSAPTTPNNKSEVVLNLPAKPSNVGREDPFLPPDGYEPPVLPPASNGVGGELKFKIGVPNAAKDNFSDAKGYKPVSIELAPARQSFFDKQGQRVPGAGGGLEFRSRANLVKLNVPGSRPIYQHMGIAEETIEWVGAFVGFDHPDPTDELENAEHGKRTEDAWTSSHGILLEMRKGRELMIELSWIDTASKQEHSVKFSNSIFYRGFIKDLKRTYATSQRVYYSVCFCITNREDLEETAGTDDGVPAALPSTNSLAATLASEAAAETAKAEEAAKAAEAAAAAAATNEFNGNIDPLKNMFNTFSANIEINANDSNSPIPNLLKKLQSFFRGGFEYTNDNAKNLENAKNGLKLIFEEIQIKHGTIFSRLKNPVDKDWIKLTLDPRAQESKDYRYGPEAIKSLHDILVSLHEEYFSNILINPSYKEKDKYNFTFKNVKSTFMYFLELQRNSSKPVPGFDLPRKGNF